MAQLKPEDYELLQECEQRLAKAERAGDAEMAEEERQCIANFKRKVEAAPEHQDEFTEEERIRNIHLFKSLVSGILNKHPMPVVKPEEMDRRSVPWAS